MYLKTQTHTLTHTSWRIIVSVILKHILVELEKTVNLKHTLKINGVLKLALVRNRILKLAYTWESIR